MAASLAAPDPARRRQARGRVHLRPLAGPPPLAGAVQHGATKAPDPAGEGFPRLSEPRHSPGLPRSLRGTQSPRAPRALGRVDGFDDDEAEGESHEGSEVLVGFLATERDALEALELADQLLDAGAGALERLRKESGPVSGRGLDRDHRADAPFARGRA